MCEPCCSDSEQVQGSIHPSITKSPVVGWPPLQTCRKNIISAHENKRPVQEAAVSENIVERERSSMFVKVIVDGMGIGRKVDLSAHNNLAVALQDMFQPPTIVKEKQPNSNQWRLLDPCSDYLMTYVDKEGDWMLVGEFL